MYNHKDFTPFLPSSNASDNSSDLNRVLLFKLVTNLVEIKEYKARNKVLNGTYPFTTHLLVLYIISFESVTCELSFSIGFIYSFPRDLLFLLMHSFWAAENFTWSYFHRRTLNLRGLKFYEFPWHKVLIRKLMYANEISVISMIIS
jgi:hypothetical protein